VQVLRGTKAIKTVAVVGAGNMGQGIAQVFAQAGRRVNLTDANEAALEHSLKQIRRNVGVCVESGLTSPENGDAALAAIRPFPCLWETLQEVDYVVESISEVLELKQRLFCEMDEACPPDVILASNTSGLRIGDISARMAHPERAATNHFWMPAHLIPIVEVVGGERTNPEVVKICCELLAEAGKKPVLVCKDVPGFIGNRMQHALVREAISIVEAGIASAEDVDAVARLSFGLRLPVTGPLEAMDLAGLDLLLNIHSSLLKNLSRDTEPAPLLSQLVAAGKVGSKAGQGFRQWTPEQVEAIKRAREADLIARLRAMTHAM
jgi:3-hydroxybutyryl-CoA dehydrogenase